MHVFNRRKSQNMYLLQLEKSQVTLISFTQFKLEFNQFKIILGVLSHYSSPLYRNVCFQEKMDINTGWIQRWESYQLHMLSGWIFTQKVLFQIMFVVVCSTETRVVKEINRYLQSRINFTFSECLPNFFWGLESNKYLLYEEFDGVV